MYIIAGLVDQATFPQFRSSFQMASDKYLIKEIQEEITEMSLYNLEAFPNILNHAGYRLSVTHRVPRIVAKQESIELQLKRISPRSGLEQSV